MKMKGFAMLGIGKTGWIEKDVPTAGCHCKTGSGIPLHL